MFVFKQKTAYEMRISDWSSDVCSADLLRRMVDEFSSFARMPKPVFREEPVLDITRQTLFLHEVAHPAIEYRVTVGEPAPVLVCDRRQIAQALTNLVKNATEAVEARRETD